MPRFRWDRESPERPKHRTNTAKPGSFNIKECERGAREPSVKSRVSVSNKRRNAPITLAGKYGVDREPS